MNIMVMDGERLVVEQMVGLLRQMEPEVNIVGLSEPEEARSYLEKCWVDVALLDAGMGELDGIGFAKRYKELRPKVNLIFVTGYFQYMMETSRLRANGYLTKSINVEKLRGELHNLRHPLTEEGSNKVRIQTFENFEIFFNEKPVDLPGTKCRECPAYLVDRRGTRVSMPELTSILWGDRPYDRKIQNSTHQVIYVPMKALKQARIQDITIKNRRELAIGTEKVDCNYHVALNGDLTQMNALTGEYMTNYS